MDNNLISNAFKHIGVNSDNLFDYVFDFTPYTDNDILILRRADIPISDITNKCITKLKEMIITKYDFFNYIWDSIFTNLYSIDESLPFFSLLVSKTNYFISYYEGQINILESQLTNGDAQIQYLYDHHQLVLECLKNINITNTNILTGFEKIHNRKNLDLDKLSIEQKAKIESEYINILYDYGLNNNIDKTIEFNNIVHSVDIKSFPVSNSNNIETDRITQAKINENLYIERLNKKIYSQMYYEILNDCDIDDYPFNEYIDKNISNYSSNDLIMFKMDMHQNIFSKLFAKVYKFDTTICEISYINDLLVDAITKIQNKMFVENLHGSGSIATKTPQKSKTLTDLENLQEYFNHIRLILENFYEGYSKWGRHFMNTYNIGWCGKKFNIYEYNVFNEKFDNTTFELFRKGPWYMFGYGNKFIETEA